MGPWQSWGLRPPKRGSQYTAQCGQGQQCKSVIPPTASPGSHNNSDKRKGKKEKQPKERPCSHWHPEDFSGLHPQGIQLDTGASASPANPANGLKETFPDGRSFQEAKTLWLGRLGGHIQSLGSTAAQFLLLRGAHSLRCYPLGIASFFKKHY